MPISGGEETQTIPPQPLKRLYRIEAPHFVAGCVVGDDSRVAEAAPVLEWALGLTWVEVYVRCCEQGWRMRHILGKGEWY